MVLKLDIKFRFRELFWKQHLEKRWRDIAELIWDAISGGASPSNIRIPIIEIRYLDALGGGAVGKG